MPGILWSKKSDALLYSLWEEGRTGSEIARTISKTFRVKRTLKACRSRLMRIQRQKRKDRKTLFGKPVFARKDTPTKPKTLSQHVRDHLAENPKDGPRTTAAALTKKGVKVSASLVSQVKYHTARKRARKQAQAELRTLIGFRRQAKPVTQKSTKTSTDQVSVAALMLAKKVAQQNNGVAKTLTLLKQAKSIEMALGSWDNARTALEVLSQLQRA